MQPLIVGGLTLLLMTFGWVSLSSAMAAESQTTHTILTAQITGVVVMCLFLPLNALTYYLFRRHRQTFEVDRILEVLSLDPKYELSYRKAYSNETTGYYFLWSVSYASVVSCLGIMLLFLGGTFFPEGEFPTVSFGGNITPVQGGESGSSASGSGTVVQFPVGGSRLIAGMAFLGAYIWGFQYILRRYTLNDLTPDVYYNLSMRMILATLVAVVIYNAYEAIAGGDGGGLTSKVWPVLAFMLGMFPQRGLSWLTERLPLVSSEVSDSVRDAPLEMIEGIESEDKLRLKEMGVDTCYDLAVADFVPLILNTPYGARQLVDWILQAKLCVYCSDGMKDLRPLGIRTILDIEYLDANDFQTLAQDTSITEAALQRAQIALQNSDEIKRLGRIGRLLGQFTKEKDEPLLES